MIDWLKRRRVLDALRYMAKLGGAWHYDNSHGVWTMANYNPSGMRGPLSFSQDEMRAFLEHYDEVTRER